MPPAFRPLPVALFAVALGACGGRVAAEEGPIAVPPDAAASLSCSLDGTSYDPFDLLTGSNGCDCICMRSGRITCSGWSCASDAGAAACDYFGVTYAVGEVWPCADGCNTCFCLEPGSWGNTTQECAAPAACAFEGKTLAAGAHVTAADGCNLCTCWADGSMSCTVSWYCVGEV